jgi:flagellar biogenesis protein FliO
MSGPAWLAGGFAILMIVIAVYCAARLAISRLRGRNTERDADALHVLMGVAMAGMLEPRLTPVPVIAWRVVFAAAAAWFAWRAIRPGRQAGGTRSAHLAAHAVECAAMVYMLLPVGSWPSGHRTLMAMPGMSQGTTIGNPALTLVLALFMLGYVLWAVDRLARLSRTPAVATAYTQAAGVPVLAPRLAASYKITMAITMGYMLSMML